VNLLLDVSSYVAENGGSDTFRFEEIMASQPERIASLETHRIWHWAALGTVAAWLAWASLSLISVSSDVRAIKQKLADGGIGPIVSAIQNPSSPQQLAANLSLLSSEIRVQRSEGRAPDQKKLDSIAPAIRFAATRNPQVPEVWQAAFQLVSFRSEVLKNTFPSSLPNCATDAGALNQIENTPETATGSGGHYWATLHDCVLNLDDDGKFGESPLASFFAEANRRRPGNGNRISMRHGIITYSGGEMIPISQLVFTDSIFNFSTPKQVPPGPGRSLASQMLTANVGEGTIDLPSGE